MLENRQCPACGADIVMLYTVPDKGYKLSNGKVVRDDNNEAFGRIPELVFGCSKEWGHDISEDGIRKWIAEVEQEFYDGGHYAD